VQPVAEPGHDAEVAAAAADRPEQVRLVVGVDDADAAVGRHDLGASRLSIVRPSCGQVADAAAES
jgi:hypothetical protein